MSGWEQTRIGSECLALSPKLVELRRDLHRHPELGLQEARTAAKVAEWLADLGLTVQTWVGGYGVVADLRGALAGGRTIALRADMDALPIQEETKLPFASIHAGVMHACGHDVHTAILLGAATMLTRYRERLCGNVRFIFQSAEEILAGAEQMIQAGVLTDVDEIYGLHNLPSLPAGKIAVKAGPLLSAVDRIEIVIEGKGGHGSMPEQCIDPIVAASAVVMGLQTAVSREISPIDSVVVTIGTFHAGTANNVIPAIVEMTGTIRTHSPEERNKMPERIARIASGIASAYRCKAEVRCIPQVPIVYNDEAREQNVREAAAQLLGQDGVEEAKLSMGGEDFACYQQHVPGCYFWLGSGWPPHESEGEAYGLHSSKLQINETCIPVGAALFTNLILNNLAKSY